MLVPSAMNGPTTGTFRTRAKDRFAGERFAQDTSPLEEWRPDMHNLVQHIEDDQVRRRDEARWEHVAVSRSSCFHENCTGLIRHTPERLQLFPATRMARLIRQTRL
jgi:hypothetical protein